MFRSSDTSIWKIIPASRLAMIEIWKGNRILDEGHVSKIRASINDDVKQLNINPFRIVSIQQDTGVTKYIVDGQHRSTILKRYFSNPDAVDFDVVVIEKECLTESDIIEYFKILNTTKSIQWKEDPVLIANKYITEFVKEFNTDPKKPVIKSGKTVRPYLSVDKLRDTMLSKHVTEWSITPLEFTEYCRQKNEEYLGKLNSNIAMEKKALDLHFALGVIDCSIWL
jgi:hypothetical protein